MRGREVPYAGDVLDTTDWFEPLIAQRADDPMLDLVAELVETADPEDRRILEAIFWERVSYAEAAHRMGLASKQAAHKRTKAALERLKKRLEALTDEDR